MTHSLGIVVNKKEPKAKETSLEPTWNIIMEAYFQWSEKSESTINAILKSMEERKIYGFNKHSVHLTPKNGRNNRNDTFQEILDAAVYVQNDIEELILSGESDRLYEVKMGMLIEILEGLFQTMERYYILSSLYED